MKQVLIIAAHGSRKASSNQEVEQLTRRIETAAAGRFDQIEHGFLQFSEPLLEKRLENAAAAGVQKIVVFPLFIGKGSHISQDIPQLVENCQKKYPDIQIVVTRHLGGIDTIDQVILKEVGI